MRFVSGLLLFIACAASSMPALAEEPLPAKYRLTFAVIDRQYTTDAASQVKEEKVIARGSKEFQTLSWKVLKKTDDPFDLVPDYNLYFLKSETHTEGYTVGGMLATSIRDGRKELSLQIYDTFPTAEESTKRKPMSLIFDAKSESTPTLSAKIMLSYDAEKKLKRTLEIEVQAMQEKKPR